MGGMNGVGVRQDVAVEVQKKQVKGAIAGGAAKVGEVIGGAAAQTQDSFVTKCPIPRPVAPPVPIQCTLPPPPPLDPKVEARELVLPVLRRTGAAQLEAYRKFTDEVNWTSTAGLKAALKLLDQEAMSIPRIPLAPPFEDPNHQVIQLLYKAIEAELQSRPKDPVDEAREMINDVTGASGAEQLKAYVRFTTELKHVSRDALEEARDQLVDRMASESDREQRLIYKLMLHAVNSELDSRHSRPFGFPGLQTPAIAPAAPLHLSVAEHSLLNSKLGAVDAGTRTAVKAMVATQD